MSSNANELTFSLIIPVYNRPVEVLELLESMAAQTVRDFEVVIVEDGSETKCDDVCRSFEDKLDLKYFFKPNSGPGQSRNYGYDRATGNYNIFLDSDCVLPPRYFEIVKSTLQTEYVDAFGGPDEAHADFSDLQKAINYSMTSVFTTGGIRGGSEKMDKFYPRSFNMGYSREVYDKTNGFAKMRFGEDIDMSIRILKNGFTTRLIKDAFVYHKRRTNFKQFFKQVYNSGIARINLLKRHPESMKLVHMLPSVFTLGNMFLVLMALAYSPIFIVPVILYMLIVCVHSSIINRSLYIGFLSIITSYIQLFGYGFGFMSAVWKRLILGQNEFSAYEKTFYK